MKHFPKPLKLPENVHKIRAKRNFEITSAILFGILIRFLIVVFEFIGVYLFHSSSLFLDGLSSLFDLFSSVVLLVFIKLAERPPDRNHPFGHGRFEPLIGSQMGTIIACIGSFLVFQQFFALKITEERWLHPLAWTFPFIAILLLELCYHKVKSVAKREKSPALLAEAIHYRIDSISSLFALVALFFASYFKDLADKMDHLGALAIALFMIVLGIKSAFENIHQLMDKAPHPMYFEKVRKAALGVKGVLGTEKLKILKYGPDAHVNIDIEVAPEMSVDQAHLVTQEVRLEIQKAWPSVRDVMVHVEPYYPNDH